MTFFSSVVLGREFLEVVLGRRLFMVAAISFTEAVHGVGLAMTPEHWWVNSVLSFVAASKYVYINSKLIKCLRRQQNMAAYQWRHWGEAGRGRRPGWHHRGG